MEPDRGGEALMGWNLLSSSRKWQDVTDLVTREITSGRVLLQRRGTDRVLAFDQLVLADAGSGNLLVIPSADRPGFTEAAQVFGLSNRVQVTRAGNVQIYGVDSLIIGRVTWSTEGVA